MADREGNSPYTQHIPCLLKQPGVCQEKRSRLKLSFGAIPVKPAPQLPVPVSNTVFKEKYFVPKSISNAGQLKIAPGRDGYTADKTVETGQQRPYKVNNTVQQSIGDACILETYDFSAEDLDDLGEIGCGNFGTVNKMLHRVSGTSMAVKRIRSTVDEKEQKQLLMDLEVVMKSNDCPYIVQFFGAIFYEGDCWICMELMDTSLDKFYKFIYEHGKSRIPENVLGRVTVATVKALNYLKEQLKIIHRDVKPSNILLDRGGNIKLCDFGISGQLVDSIAKTRDAGCRPYMAPERIDPTKARCYDVRSDVWSLGITLFELATGRFPYPKWNSVFEQLTQVVQGDAPRLTAADSGHTFTAEFVNFVNTCLDKDESRRPKYNRLLQHAFLQRSEMELVDVAAYVNTYLDAVASNQPPESDRW